MEADTLIHISEDATPGVKMWRNSYKYRIIPSHTRLMMDMVFADNPAEAEMKGRERYEIPADELVVVERVDDLTNLPMRLN